MKEPEHGHEAVMVEEVAAALALRGRTEERLVVMDCTLGRGGHGERIMREMGAAGGGVYVGLDVDPANLKYARKRLEGIAAKVELRTFHANFAEAGDVLDVLNMDGVDGLLADLGVSTNQLLDEKHGLSFNADTPLDMRLDPRIDRTAADLIGEWDEKRIATILQEYAQERFAWRIARKIIQTRAREPILTTGQLARLVRSVVPHGGRPGEGSIDPATRTFQALRMAVNEEPEHLAELLACVPVLMNSGGRAVFLSFHSGEDRLVKQAIRGWEEAGVAEAVTKKPLEPGEEEMRRNPRSRSAKMRVAAFSGKQPARTDQPEP